MGGREAELLDERAEILGVFGEAALPSPGLALTVAALTYSNGIATSSYWAALAR